MPAAILRAPFFLAQQWRVCVRRGAKVVDVDSNPRAQGGQTYNFPKMEKTPMVSFDFSLLQMPQMHCLVGSPPRMGL